MKITLCYSITFSEKAEEIKKKLEKFGHQVFIVKTNNKFLGKNDEEKEKIKLKQKYEEDAISEHFSLITNSDSILIINYEKNNIPNYIGGNVFLEMGVSHYLKKPTYLLNPIPDMSYSTEIIAMKPIIINNDLTKIPL